MIEDNPLKIRASGHVMDSKISLYITQGNHRLKHLNMIPIEEGEYVPETMKIKYEQAQTLMDDLWNCGIRPSEGSGSSGSLRATEKHLNDMRKITFHKLNIK